MALDFLENIYEKAMLIQYTKETLSCLHENTLSRAIDLKWRGKVLPTLSSICKKESQSFLCEPFITASKSMADLSRFEGAIQSELLPALYQYIEQYNVIDVEESSYRLHSSKSGFLTLFDMNRNTYIHSTYDPMDEAKKFINRIYDPAKDEYCVIGVGLGYIPYQLWKLSDESIKLRVFETDVNLVQYAYDYGVLNWISDGDIEVVIGDMEENVNEFLKRVNNQNVGGFISPWLELDILFKYSNLGTYMLNRCPNDKYFCVWTINIRKNMCEKVKSFDLLADRIKPCRKTIIVAGGPSLDDNTDFLVSEKDSSTIIAVDAAVRALINKNIIPNIIVAVDSNESLMHYIAGVGDLVKDIPLIMTPLTYWKYVKEYSGPKYCIQTRDSVSFLGKKDNAGPYLDHASIAVTGTALEVAYYCGAKEIYLVGADLGFPGGKLYAESVVDGTMADIADGTVGISVDGESIRTTPTFLEFKRSMEKQIAFHKGETRVINMSQHGLDIAGTERYHQQKRGNHSQYQDCN